MNNKGANMDKISRRAKEPSLFINTNKIHQNDIYKKLSSEKTIDLYFGKKMSYQSMYDIAKDGERRDDLLGKDRVYYFSVINGGDAVLTTFKPKSEKVNYAYYLKKINDELHCDLGKASEDEFMEKLEELYMASKSYEFFPSEVSKLIVNGPQVRDEDPIRFSMRFDKKRRIGIISRGINAIKLSLLNIFSCSFRFRENPKNNVQDYLSNHKQNQGIYVYTDDLDILKRSVENRERIVSQIVSVRNEYEKHLSIEEGEVINVFIEKDELGASYKNDKITNEATITIGGDYYRIDRNGLIAIKKEAIHSELRHYIGLKLQSKAGNKEESDPGEGINAVVGEVFDGLKFFAEENGDLKDYYSDKENPGYELLEFDTPFNVGHEQANNLLCKAIKALGLNSFKPGWQKILIDSEPKLFKFFSSIKLRSVPLEYYLGMVSYGEEIRETCIKYLNEIWGKLDLDTNFPNAKQTLFPIAIRNVPSATGFES
ncbi:MAG: hypothetical protein NT030_08320, partial [Candidatus Saganbacteria bacterium]|nr:hypothetical protein [Candidatus Saganbacteria bacterium]